MSPLAPQRVVVMAAALTDPSGRYLLGGRTTAQGLRWEFPGGKCEPKETPLAALKRELDEELGVQVRSASPLHRVPFSLDGRPAVLDAWRIHQWDGEPRACEGQPLAWARPQDLTDIDWLAADWPIVSALRLGRRLAITPDANTLDAALLAVECVFAATPKIVLLRFPSLAVGDFVAVAEHAKTLAQAHAVPLLARAPVGLVRQLGLDGLHLTGEALRTARNRPLPRRYLVTAACHDALELIRAVRIGADAVLISPVCATATHPQLSPIGWSGFAALAKRSPLPAYALGGVSPDDLAHARKHGGFGVAGIRGFV